MKQKLLIVLSLCIFFALAFTFQPRPIRASELLEIRAFSTSVYMPVVVRNFTVADTSNMVYIPAGEFWFGCDPLHNGGFPCPTTGSFPLQKLYLDEFYIDKTEVTNFEYAQCVNAGVCDPPVNYSSATRSSYFDNPKYADYPVIYIEWGDAQDYCVWAGKRLPLEEEWEKAARGSTDTRAYPWGDQDPNCNLANSYNNATSSMCVGDTTKIGSYPAGASPYGVLDMSGNVLEWTRGINTAIIGRNGCFQWGWQRQVIIDRWPYSPDVAQNIIGFRCAYAP
jgi:formylglycine-generating enzyme required for sulfatase activity